METDKLHEFLTEEVGFYAARVHPGGAKEYTYGTCSGPNPPEHKLIVNRQANSFLLTLVTDSHNELLEKPRMLRGQLRRLRGVMRREFGI